MNNDDDFNLFKSAVFFKSFGNRKSYIFSLLAENNISFESILYRIYFEGYSFEDIKDHIYPPLRKVKNVESFFELLFSVIKTYCIVIEDFFL